MQLGIDRLMLEGGTCIRGMRLGLLTNASGCDGLLRSTSERLMALGGSRLVALFAPEHGINGEKKAGMPYASDLDSATRLPVHSLYGESRRPDLSQLEEIDAMVVDVQDIGSRYYTFNSTLALVMQACGEAGKQVIVLDRPNPIGGVAREGNFIAPTWRSFVGFTPLPNRHGLTIGELAYVYRYVFNINCQITVIPMSGWRRTMFFSETGLSWVQPSPNATGELMALLYPGMCLIEGTTLSEGRGTTRPFEVVGAPFIDGYWLAKAFNRLQLPGVRARRTQFIPANSKYAGELCDGVQMHVTDRRLLQPLGMGLALLGLIAARYEDQFTFVVPETGGRAMFDLLTGDPAVRAAVRRNDCRAFREECRSYCDDFTQRVSPYLIYGTA